MQALDRSHHAALQDNPVAHWLHSQNSYALLDQTGHNLSPEATKMRIHHVQGKLTGIKVKLMSGSNVEHAQVNGRVLVSRKSDVTDLACLFRFQHRFKGPARSKEAIRVLHADIFMKLNEVDVVRLKPLQRFVDLHGSRLFRAAVELCHQECLLAVT